LEQYRPPLRLLIFIHSNINNIFKNAHCGNIYRQSLKTSRIPSNIYTRHLYKTHFLHKVIRIYRASIKNLPLFIHSNIDNIFKNAHCGNIYGPSFKTSRIPSNIYKRSLQNTLFILSNTDNLQDFSFIFIVIYRTSLKPSHFYSE